MEDRQLFQKRQGLKTVQNELSQFIGGNLTSLGFYTFSLGKIYKYSELTPVVGDLLASSVPSFTALNAVSIRRHHPVRSISGKTGQRTHDNIQGRRNKFGYSLAGYTPPPYGLPGFALLFIQDKTWRPSSPDTRPRAACRPLYDLTVGIHR